MYISDCQIYHTGSQIYKCTFNMATYIRNVLVIAKHIEIIQYYVLSGTSTFLASRNCFCPASLYALCVYMCVCVCPPSRL